MRSRFRNSLAALAAAMVALAGCAHVDDPTGTIERKYFADGPWPVTSQLAAPCCAANGFATDLYYPTNLGANGFKHPVITWGNGTAGTSSDAAYFLRHLASWGFVVVASQDGYERTGASILAAAHKMVDENSRPASPFFNKLDISHIGAVGHSQGAGGAVWAMINSYSTVGYPPIVTVIPIELPAQHWCLCPPNEVLDTVNVTQGSIFFVDGSADVLVSPPTQPPQVPGEQSIQAFYDAITANGVLKLKGTLLAANHNDIDGQPKCHDKPFCDVGVYGYLGYPTAWLMYQLGQDPAAKAAFVSGSGEMFQQQSHWSYLQSNVQ
jgi:hypothetical protein